MSESHENGRRVWGFENHDRILRVHPRAMFRPLIVSLPELPYSSFPASRRPSGSYGIEDIAARQVETLRRFRPEGQVPADGMVREGRGL